jgi:hypothetical protein
MATLERPDGEQRPALVHDLSESGALLLARTTKIAVDDEVTVFLHGTDGDKTPRTAMGVIVRVEALSPDDSGPWLRRVAVRFHEPIHMYPSEIEGFRLRAQRLGIAQ